MAPSKYYFFYGRRKPSQSRPIVEGGLFTNRKTRGTVLPPLYKPNNKPPTKTFNPDLWNPDCITPKMQTKTHSSSEPSSLSSASRKLSPIARYVCDTIRRHGTWGPQVLSDLNKLHRVPPSTVTEILKSSLLNPSLSSRFFNWATNQKGFRHNFSCYNALACCLHRANRHRAADQVPDLMRAHNKEPTSKQFELLIRLHAESGRGLRVHYVYQKMREFGCKPSVFVINRVMDALIRTEHIDLAMAVFEDIDRDGLVPEGISFMILVKGLCREGRLDEAFTLLGQMREKACKPDVFAYTAMLKALVSSENFNGCWKVWEEMERDGVHPDAMCCTTLVGGLCKAGEIEKAYGVFKEMKADVFLIDRSVYGSLISSFVAMGKVAFACGLLKEMNDSGYRADLSIYNSLIEGLCDANENGVNKAYKLFQIAIREGLVPSFLTTNPLLLAYADANRLDDMFMLIEQMSRLGPQPVEDNLFKFFSFMVGKGEKQRVLKSLEVFKALKERGYCSVSIYNILISGLHKVREVKSALSLFEEMEKGSGEAFKPDAFTYSNVIPCFIDEGELKEACSLYNKLKEMSWTPSVPAYCSLVKGLCRDGEIDAAILLVRDCLGHVTSGPLVFKYTLNILHACKSGKADKVIEVLNEMMQQGCPPEDVIYCAIIGGMCRHGNVEEARKVFAAMRQRNLLSEANLALYDKLLIEHLTKTTSNLVHCGLKFFGLESKIKWSQS
ncbi:hypothetical protein AMTRI_Chr11g150270 [Amborella trichopoda]|uniref:Pentacotripeptide-repeat region of PRORP domain-containing protein n=1 Tax=Amborella trichopoda TaxID=13333 RepID=W1PY41_AMBTC|nr:pentatricopeptide repeat-containing protein At4g20740 [Amborella trichopoda]ERN13178.1 hypothetical protein AMTR_s00040p00209940 [Amborella trichopoda]|eukprot:XP_006851711.1 pentatricopeptide repeat-containing protein At4g20740 [Amborella trichopoda]